MFFSTYLANKLLDHCLRNTAYTQAANVYLSLHTADPGATGSSEVAGGTYARQAITFDAANAKATQNSGKIDFNGMPAVTVSHFGIWDNSVGGNFLIGGAATAPKAVGAGDTFEVAIGALDVALN